MRKDNRSRHWSFVGYPDDSLPENYREILSDEMHLCWCESPVHDADLNGDGSEKKKHIHFVVSFEGNKSFDQIKEITDALHCPIPQQVRNLRAMIRYMVHIDNPDKTQYKIEDIKCFGGYQIGEYFSKSTFEYLKILNEIVSFCDDNNITEFCDLAKIAQNPDLEGWFEVVTSRYTMFLSAYVKSRRHKERDEMAGLYQ